MLSCAITSKQNSERERQEREDWALEVALLMRNRFMAYEVYEEWGEGKMTRAQWRHMANVSPGMVQFRQVMFRGWFPICAKLTDVAADSAALPASRSYAVFHRTGCGSAQRRAVCVVVAG